MNTLLKFVRARTQGFTRTLLALTSVVALAGGCGDSSSAAPATTSEPSPVTRPTGDDVPAPGAGTADAGNPSVGDGDDPSTPGNDSPLATACAGTPSCPYATHTCCVADFGKAECSAGGTCPKSALGVAAASTVCDGVEDCPAGKVCCVSVSVTGAKNSCEESCEGLGGSINDWQLCHVDEECPEGQTCEPNSTFPYWGFCG